jgi:hypothetical protein
MDAVRYFAKDVTPPLLYGPEGSVPRPIGTASLLRVSDRLFLVSVAHNFENDDLSFFAIPENRQKGRPIGLSGDLCRPTRRHRDLMDVSVLALTPSCAERVLAAGWRQLTLENICPATEQGIFVLCGYPSVKVSQSGDTIVSTLVTAFTERMPEPPKNAKFTSEPDPAVDLFFHYDATATDTDGAAVRTPRLHGASGANVWQYFEPRRDELWTPDKAIKAVAIQASVVEHECFRAKTWGVPLSAIRIAYPELSESIEPMFGNVLFEGQLANE